MKLPESKFMKKPDILSVISSANLEYSREVNTVKMQEAGQ